MKYCIKVVLMSTIVILCVGEVYSQTAYSEIKPSVNAQQFISPISSLTSLHTGQLSVNIPLLDLPAKGINVPISLSFNSAGITHESEASNIGLGWSLMAGGVITQSIRGSNDFDHTKRKPWHYDASYLVNKKWEQDQTNIENLFEIALEAVNNDSEPDIFKYSFLGYSGDICLKYNADGNRSWTLYPDKSFRLEKTTVGFKIIANDGTEYFFEDTEKKAFNLTSHTTSWFLTRIMTIHGGAVTFFYEDDYSYDYTWSLGTLYAHDKSKRIDSIVSDYGYVTFIPADRSDKSWPDIYKKSRKIIDIQLYNKAGSLVKGYELDNASHFLNEEIVGDATAKDKRLKLRSIREYGSAGQSIHHDLYKFEYDHFFVLPKNSLRRHNPVPPLPNNTWAHNPGNVASVDRDITYGWLSPSWYCYDYTPGGTCMPALDGFDAQPDPMGSSVHDYLCLTKVEYPTGGSESYYYEGHDYGLYFNSKENLPSYYDQNLHIMGKRLWIKEIKDGSGNSQTILYKYRLHDQDYQLTKISSGILINPSIHTSTIYKPVSHGSFKEWLAATPYCTPNPQNSPSGSSVYYTEVEEVLTSVSTEANNGKKIYYFEKMYALPAANYIYINYTPINGKANRLINLPNTLYGKQQYLIPEIPGLSNTIFTYMNYPVGRFYISHLNEGKLLKEIILNSDNEIVRKIENVYTLGDGIEQSQYGLVVEKFDDTNHSNNPYPSTNRHRYLISQTQFHFGVRELIKRITTDYYQDDSIKQEQDFVYTDLNLPKFITTKLSNGSVSIQENVYPNEIVFSTTSNLSKDASAIRRMKDILNMIGIPIQTTVKNGMGYIDGSYTTFKQLPNGSIVIDTVCSLNVQAGATVSDPFVNTNGNIIRNNNFLSNKTFLSYDSHGNPTTVIGKDGVNETIVWGHGGQYPVARIVNYTYDQLQNNNVVLNQLALLDNFGTISDIQRAELNNCNLIIRNNLSGNAMVSTYTYSPLIGMTSASDPMGITTYYEYDSFGRLQIVRDHEGNIVQQYDYHYQNQ